MTPDEFGMDDQAWMWELYDVANWGKRPAGTPAKDLDRTPQQLNQTRDHVLATNVTEGLWTVAFDFYTSPQLGYTTAVGDLATITGLDHHYVHSLVAWVMNAAHPDIVDLYESDQPET